MRIDAHRRLEAQIHVCRKSLSVAKQRAEEALALDLRDARARDLHERVLGAESTDAYAEHQGRTAVGRIRARGAAAGMALRERGVSTGG